MSIRRSSSLTILLILAYATITACQSNQKKSGESGSKQSFEKIDKTTFEKMMDRPNTVVLDVRTDMEFKKGHVPNAVHINYYAANFNDEVAKLDTSKTYLVYCHSGSRSYSACEIMTSKLNFPHVYDFAGGWKAWSSGE